MKDVNSQSVVVPVLLEAGLRRIIAYSSFLNVGMLKRSSREDRRVKKRVNVGAGVVTDEVLCL